MRRAIVIRNSSQPEPVFPIPSDATPEEVAAALAALIEVGGLDAEVVPLEATATAAEFRARIAAFASSAAEG